MCLFMGKCGQNGEVHWEATDNFGNLCVGVSGAEGWEALREDVKSLLEELAHRHPGGGQMAVDFEYGEMCGPSPDEVSRVMQVAWLVGKGEEFERVAELVREVAEEAGIGGFEVVRGS